MALPIGPGPVASAQERWAGVLEAALFQLLFQLDGILFVEFDAQAKAIQDQKAEFDKIRDQLLLDHKNALDKQVQFNQEQIHEWTCKISEYHKAAEDER